MPSLWKLLTLLAVLLLPLGMAPAAAAPVRNQMAMPMQHCPDQSPQQRHDGFTECTMACAAALPAMESQTDAPLMRAAPVAQASPIEPLHGLHPETATPPPRLA